MDESGRPPAAADSSDGCVRVDSVERVAILTVDIIASPIFLWLLRIRKGKRYFRESIEPLKSPSPPTPLPEAGRGE